MGISSCAGIHFGSLVVATSSRLGGSIAVNCSTDSAFADPALSAKHCAMDWRHGRIAAPHSTGSLSLCDHRNGLYNDCPRPAGRHRHSPINQAATRPGSGGDVCGDNCFLHSRQHHLQPPLPMKNQLRELRAAKEWSQSELAEKLGVSRQTVNAIETEKYDPSLPLAFKVERLFKLPIEKIFEHD